MPPQQAGEIYMYMHSGERQQPLPYQVPAISSGESSLASFLLGHSCPWLMEGKFWGSTGDIVCSTVSPAGLQQSRPAWAGSTIYGCRLGG
jgi:hypothetical protein